MAFRLHLTIEAAQLLGHDHVLIEARDKRDAIELAVSEGLIGNKSQVLRVVFVPE